MRKNDKISIYNNQPKGKEELIADYYKNNIEFIEKLTTMRDKVCSHFDLDFIDMCKTISIGEIGDAIEFLSKAIKE